MTFQELEKERMKKISHFRAVIAGLTFFYWFGIGERGKTVLLVRKYDALPVDRKHYYTEKTKFALRKWLLLFCWCILIYFLEMLMYNIPLNWGRFLIESAAALLLVAAVQGLCVLLAATQDWWSRRMGTTAEG